jgi:signal transduction histidine kinase/CheY-like chemotaxis protein
MKDLHILILEDEPADAELAERELRKGGITYSSRRVETKEAFLKELKDFKPDIVLADYRLPSFDGLSALMIVKEQCPDVPFIFVSGAIGEEFAIETIKKGATDYVLKGRLSSLVPAVNRALREVEGRAERKQAEEALQESIRLIDQAKREWESSVDSIPQVICLIDCQGYIFRVNRAVERWNIDQVANVKGKKIHEFLHPACADSACYLKTFLSQAWEQLSYGRSTECEYYDSVLGRYIQVQIQPILPDICRIGGETESYAVVVVHDITGRKKGEERLKEYANELERANEELRKIDEIKSEFVSVASHELRTPLAAIKSAVQLILKGKTGEINESQEKFLSMADRNINRLTNILNNFLDLSRIESGKIWMNFEEIDLKGPIEFTLSLLKTKANEKSIQLKIDFPSELPSVYADRERLEQILTNLIGNAIKFTPENGEISVSAKPLRREKNMVAISVRDSGIGIPEEQLNKVFDKFYQVEDSLQRSVSGTGLGLAITKGLIEASHGKVWVESEVGKGSTFTFTLPISKGEKRDLRFRFIFNKEFQRALENHSSLTLLLIEVLDESDEGKETSLEQLEEGLNQCLNRKTDIVVRLGRGKMLAALCEADLNGARVICQRIEEEFQKHSVEGRHPPPIIKVGMATYPEEVLSKRELFRKAKGRLMEVNESKKDFNRR